MVLTLYKPLGWTPLEAMEAHRAETPGLAGERMVYAGRLDPMADGLLLVLTGEDRHSLDAHLGHDKDYEATFLFGVGSDTFDALGRLGVARVPTAAPDREACLAAVSGLPGEHRLPIPPWSAYRVRGRPLHAWAREGRLGELTLPMRTMVVTAVCDVTATPVDAAAVVDEVSGRIATVRGVFRQEEARADWQRLSEEGPPLVAVRGTLTVTTGTFVRALAHTLGEALGCGGLLLHLRRTRIGPYRHTDASPRRRTPPISR